MERKGISGFTLKMIALVTMLIDHFAATVLEGYLLGYRFGYCNSFVNADNFERWNRIYDVLRGVGRMAFPIYCFLLVEGFLYTRNVKKYIGRLFIFALISEIPFDFAIFQATNGENFTTVFDYWGNSEVFVNWLRWMMSYQNVYFTLCFGLITIALIDWIQRNFPISTKNDFLNKLSLMLEGSIILAIIAVICVLAEYVFHTDYSAAGVLAIVFMYMLRQRRMLAYATGVIVLAILCGSVEALALFMLIPLYFYNGTRGKQAKYVFYGFYPVHLLVLGILCVALGLK